MTNKRTAVLGFDFVNLCVGNVHQSSHYFRTAFGFEPLWSSGPDGGIGAATISTMLGQGGVRLMLTTAVQDGDVNEHIHRHGDSVRDIGLLVDDVDAAFERSTANGARPVSEPRQTMFGNEAVRIAAVGTPADLVHSLVQRDSARVDASLHPTSAGDAVSPGFSRFDHVALAVEHDQLGPWVDFYQKAFGFTVTHQELTATEYTAMQSMVVENASGTVRFPIMQPASGRRRSQIEDFLVHHRGPGVQHLALQCDDIGTTVRRIRSTGIQFLDVPDAYYDSLPSRIADWSEHMEILRSLRVLIDRDEWGLLLQCFTKSVTGRPTLFFELVQRQGARGFGKGNIRALFEAVEREQMAREGKAALP